MTVQFRLKTVRMGTPRQSGEGLRIGTVRILPRGIRKLDYARLNYFDVWLPNLAPSDELLSQWNNDELSVTKFFARYRREMKRPEPRHLIQLLAELAKRTPIAVACYCEDESCCHRSVLGQLIREARRT